MKTQVTFLIASYKNLPLLKKSWQAVLKEAQSGDQIIISEDGVDDKENLIYFKTYYHLQKIDSSNSEIDCWTGEINFLGKKISCHFLQRKVNGRFARSVNEAVLWVLHPYFLLLNNDVILQAGARRQLLAQAQKKNVFAVSAREIDRQTKQISGKNRLWWHKGRFWHARDNNWSQTGSTAWACGGSSLFKTQIWRTLGGFDLAYYPAYWEDIDLSYRAKQAGYQIIYAAPAVVDHTHETTNQVVFGANKMQAMSWRGGSIFAWKHARWKQKIQFLFFYPWWQLKQFPAYKWWYLVLIFALVTRLAFLNSTPAGLTVDEVAIAYNGYGIFTQRRDEWLNRLPISFRSYGDYKAPLAIYLNGFFTGLLGREIWVIRLPFVLASILSIYVMMLLSTQFLESLTPRAKTYASIIGFLMATSPWHFHYGRLGFENNFALFFILLTFYFLRREIKELENKTVWRSNFLSLNLLSASLASVASLYSYHSSKVFLPLFLLIILFYYRRIWWQKRKKIILPFLLALLLLYPLGRDSFIGEGLTRAQSSFLLEKNLLVKDKIQLLGQNFLIHFQPSFLFGGQLNLSTDLKNKIDYLNYRHGDGKNGVLTYTMLILFIIAGGSWLSSLQKNKTEKELWFWALIFIILGFLPATLTRQIPHSNQAFLALPGFLLLATLGLLHWPWFWQRRREFQESFLWLLLVLAFLGFLNYQSNYYQLFNRIHSSSTKTVTTFEHQAVAFLFAQNLFQAFQDIYLLEKQVDLIMVATGFEHEYIYALLARGTRPISYQHGSLSEKYKFVSQINASDGESEKTLILASPNSLPAEAENWSPHKLYYNNSGVINLLLYYLP